MRQVRSETARFRPFSRGGLPVAGFLFSLLGAVPARAATFFVTDTSDSLDALPGDGLCATATSSCTLRAAIQEANALGGMDRIVLGAATYVLSRAGTGEDAAVSGDLDVLDDVEIEATNAVIDGSQLDRVFDFLVGSSSISGGTIQGGVGDVVAPLVEPVGGGILNRAVLTLDHVTLRENLATFGAGFANLGPSASVSSCSVVDNHGGHGGGLYCYDTSLLTVSDSEILRNLATSGSGGGIENAGHFIGTRLTIRDNVSSGGAGGGIFNGSESMAEPLLELTDSTIENNASSGGGLYNGGLNGIVRAPATAVLERCVFKANTAEDATGGAIVNTIGSEITLRDGRLEGNSALGGTGGGIFNTSGATVRLERVSVSGGSTGGGSGGGLYNELAATMILVNTTVSGNADTGLVNRTGGAVRLRSVTIASNSGDGIHFNESGGGTIVARNTILANNAPANCAFGSGDVLAEGPLLEYGGGPFSCSEDATIVGVDPQLFPLALDAYSTYSHGLRSSSPAIDAGDPAGCLDDDGSFLATDQRGNPRTRGARCDVGAVEFDGPCFGGSTLGTIDLRIRNLDDGTRRGDERLSLTGSIPLSPSALAAFDPMSTGLQLVLRSEESAPAAILEFVAAGHPIPAGGLGTGCGAFDGWQRGSAASFVYRNESGALPPDCAPGSAVGLRRLRLRLNRARGILRFRGSFSGSIAAPTGPPVVMLVLGAASAAGEQGLCGSRVLTPSQCRASGHSPNQRYVCRE